MRHRGAGAGHRRAHADACQASGRPQRECAAAWQTHLTRLHTSVPHDQGPRVWLRTSIAAGDGRKAVYAPGGIDQRPGEQVDMVRARPGLEVPGARMLSKRPRFWRSESQSFAWDTGAQQSVAKGPKHSTLSSRRTRADPYVSHVHPGRFGQSSATFPCSRMLCRQRQAADSALTCDQQRAVAAAKDLVRALTQGWRGRPQASRPRCAGAARAGPRKR